MIQHFNTQNRNSLAEFIHSYLSIIPDAKLMSPDFYSFHPVIRERNNAFFILDADGRMTGFAAIFPPRGLGQDPTVHLPELWMIVLGLPGLTEGNETRARLLAAVEERAQQLKDAYQLVGIRLASDMMIGQKADIDFLNLHHICFPERSKSVETLQFLLRSPGWQQVGTTIAAYTANEVVGSILLYQDETSGAGMMDDVMVLPGWRGRGVAKALVAAGLRYYRANSTAEIHLEVREDNLPAIAVYTRMGFREINREVLLYKLV
jgi:ribosomal protein S18 acetylase RimI-like enzyme